MAKKAKPKLETFGEALRRGRRERKLTVMWKGKEYTTAPEPGTHVYGEGEGPPPDPEPEGFFKRGGKVKRRYKCGGVVKSRGNGRAKRHKSTKMY